MITDFEGLAAKQFEFPDNFAQALEAARKKKDKKQKKLPLRNEKGQFMSKEPKQKKEEMTVSKIQGGQYEAFNRNVESSSNSSVCKLGRSSISFVTMMGFCAGGLLYYPYFNSVEEGTELLGQIEKRASTSGRKYGLLIAFIYRNQRILDAFTNAGYKEEEFISPRYGRGSKMSMMYKIINQPIKEI